MSDIHTSIRGVSPSILDNIARILERRTIGPQLADALKAEACRRVALGTFYGHLTYASLLATR